MGTFARILFWTMVAVLVVAARPAPAADVEHGRKLARKYCARCHVVGDFNPHGGIGSTPSLQWIKKLGDWRERFRTFYIRRPHLAFIKVEDLEPLFKRPSYATPVDLSQKDADDIFAYVETLPVPKGR